MTDTLSTFPWLIRDNYPINPWRLDSQIDILQIEQAYLKTNIDDVFEKEWESNRAGHKIVWLTIAFVIYDISSFTAICEDCCL